MNLMTWMLAAATAAGAAAAIEPPADAPRSVPATKMTVPPGQPAKPEKAPITLRVGDAAPPLKVTSWVKGEPVQSFERGRVYVVEFWATWCGPCIANIPHLTDLQKRYEGVTFVSVAASERKPKGDAPDKRLEGVAGFVEKQGDKMGYRVAFDADRSMGDPWMKASGQGGIPCCFVVDGDGKIAWIGHPSGLEDQLKIVAGSPAPSPGKEPGVGK